MRTEAAPGPNKPFCGRIVKRKGTVESERHHTNVWAERLEDRAVDDLAQIELDVDAAAVGGPTPGPLPTRRACR
jgi:hypothetical protein